MNSNTIFPNYTQMKRYIPIPVWNGIRLVSVGLALGVILTLFVQPELGLFIMWRLIIPFVPLLFFIAPGIWRNICPLAAMNQTPRLFDFTRALTAPAWFKEYGYVIGIGLFVTLVSMRKVIFNYNGPALAVLLIVLLTAALIMGSVYKGKSGWCSSICPLLPVQRIYGQTPFVKVANSHCQPCVGCTKNCYDFNPHVAYLADVYDDDKRFATYRKFFVGLFPGFILAFYLLPSPGAPSNSNVEFFSGMVNVQGEITVLQMYALFAIISLFSVGLFYLLDSFLKSSPIKITTIFGGLALNFYYWFNAVLIGQLFGEGLALTVAWALRGLVLALTLMWIYNTYQKERKYISLTVLAAEAEMGANRSIVAHRSSGLGNPEVKFEPEGKRVAVKSGKSILEVAEANNLSIESGCRMGVCGADPIMVLDGQENLSKKTSDEKTTLERLGLGDDCRMACVARIKGNCTISLKPEKPKVFSTSMVEGFKYDKAVEKVVIVGNGIAGVTAADHVRRRHPTCEIHLIGRESHNLYNRMAITKLIYGRSAMDGLYLLPDKWYKDYNITTWLNTHVKGIDTDAKKVHLGTGESLDYDRLILTTGSESWVPPIENYGKAGCYVLRTAEDAMNIRHFIQKNEAQHAVVAGGGLLGLEAAYALHKVGMRVAVLERGESLLRRQLDTSGGQILQSYLEGLGLQIVTNATAQSVHGNGHIEKVELKDERKLPCDLLLVATGIRSNLSLPSEIGLDQNRGVIVDAGMQTSRTGIYAAGDVAEFDGKVLGLWTAAVNQAEVAAANAVAPVTKEEYTSTYEEIIPVTMLKVVGIDITSMGDISEEEKDEIIAFKDDENHRYRKLLIKGGKIEGAILIGYSDEARGVSEAVKERIDISQHLPAIRQGDWQPLIELVE
ncbi:MAG: FAD-dependent oxidoreductase [Chloroflexota bacterium]